MKRILVTGGAGFIGSNFVHYLLETYTDVQVTVLDALTYAGNRENLTAWENDPRMTFVHGDIRNGKLVRSLLSAGDAIVHMAAETHVDRSIEDATEFISTNVSGTEVLLAAARACQVSRFLHVSTDEVYGSIQSGSFCEESALRPSSPYSASKAASDLLVAAHHTTFGTPVVITRCTNNFGPYQYPEKVIPFFVTQALANQALPLYGDGGNVRDWLYVRDHCEALDLVLQQGELGTAYNIGSGFEINNLELTRNILRLLKKPEDLVRYVQDRPGHDRRYAVNTSRLQQLGWKPRRTFDEALAQTVGWYVDHEAWWTSVKERQEEYKRFLAAQYPALRD